jgi:FixJ family two-component response regulator
MDVTADYTAQNLSARQRDVMNLIVRGLCASHQAKLSQHIAYTGV